MLAPILYAAALLIVPAVVAFAPAAGRPVAVLVPAGATPAEAAMIPVAAGGRLLSADPDRPLVYAIFDQPGFALRLWRAGAVLAVDAATLQLCLPTKDRNRTP